jgi:carbon monoxide dehydrogenase subunit G
MEIEQSFTVPYPRDAVWECFHDTPGIVACLPGASLNAPPENGLLKLAMTVKLGPIVASFAGDGEMKLDEADYKGSVSGGGVDRKSASRVKGVAGFSLDGSIAGETRVDVKVDYTIAGSLAQFSRGGIVKELATRMTEAFATNLKAKLDATVREAVVVAEPVAEPVVERVDEPAITVAPEPEVMKPSPSPKVPPPSAAHVTPPAQPLNLGNMFWKILWSRLRGFLGMGTR